MEGNKQLIGKWSVPGLEVKRPRPFPDVDRSQLTKED
jgi:hypothetical protein